MDSEQTPTRKKKILLVEDDNGLAKVYKTRLEAEGFEVNHVPTVRTRCQKHSNISPT